MQMRRRDRQIDDLQARELLKVGEYGVLSTVDGSGQPYGVPLSYVLIGNQLYLHSAPEGHKLSNIAVNSKVCFTVVGRMKLLPERFSTAYESVIVDGTASIVNDEEKVTALGALVEKYSAAFVSEGNEYIQKAQNSTAVIKVAISHISGKSRSDW